MGHMRAGEILMHVNEPVPSGVTFVRLRTETAT